MKKRLLSMLTAILAVLSINAQNYLDLSTLKGEHDEVPDSVYLYNVVAKGFLCGGNAWGTQATIGSNGLLFVITHQEDGTYTIKTSSGAKSGQYVFCDGNFGTYIDMGNQGHQYWNIIKNEENEYYRIKIAETDNTFGPEFRDWENEFLGWVYGTNDDGSFATVVSPDAADLEENGLDWAFVSQEMYAKMSKRVNLENAIANCENFGIPTETFTSIAKNPNATDEQIQEAIDNINARINLCKAIESAWNNDYGYSVPDHYDKMVENMQLTTAELQEAINNLNARVSLWNEIVKAEEAGVNTSSYTTIVNDLSKTTEELNEAKAAVTKEVDMIQVEENSSLLEGATDTEPINLFEYGIMVNADYSEKNIDGWTGNLKGGNGGQIDPNGTVYTNGSIRIEHFAESWTGNAQQGSGYGDFYQKVGLPAGLYILEADIIATRQSGSKADSKGVELFAENTTTGEVYAIPVATANERPEHFTLNFKGEAGVYKIGVREDNTTCNWIAMDNWSLVYYGNTDKPLEQINLGKTIVSIEERYANHGEFHANMTAQNNYDAILNEAQGAYENGGLADPAEYTVLGDSLTAVYNRLSSSIRDYEFFAQQITAVEARVAEQEEINANCAAEIADYLDEIREEYEKQEWTREEIDLILSHVADIMAKYTDVKPGDDVTFYLNNAKFTENFSGWNLVGATPGYMKNHGQGENANADLCQEVPEENDGLAECFHALFDMSQTIKNLPAGLYTLSVQAFNRSDDGVNEPGVLYAKFSDGSEQTVKLADINEYKTEDRLYVKNNADGNPEWMSDAGRDGDTYWVPNGMTGAAWHFVNKKDGENYDYTNKFQILMKEDGDLTVGVRVENTHQWIIWDNFTLVYEGSGSAVWVAPLEEEIAKIDARCQEAGITTGEQKVIDDVIDAANALIKNIEDATEDDCMAMLETLKAQYAAINENVALQAEAEAMYDFVFAAEEKYYDEAEAELQERFDAVKGIFTDGFSIDDLNNEEIKAAIDEIKAVVNLMKMPKGWQDASDENPVDFSAVIANRFFNPDGSEDPEEEPAPVQNHNFTEWQGKQFGTGGGTPGNCGEVWNSSAFDSYMELTGLPEGTYVLANQGFLRHGGGTANSYKVLNGEADQTVWAYLYGESSEGKYSVEMHNIAEVQLNEEALAEQEIDITPGNSTFGDNFKGADQLKTADNFFKAGYYKNEVTVKVGQDGKLRIGVQKVGAIGQDWVVIDNFSLIYLGSNSSKQPSDDPLTSIDEVETTTQNAIFTITGLRVNKMAKPGLYIIGGRKVLVK